MTHDKPRAVITIGLRPEDVGGRPLREVEHDVPLMMHVSRQMQAAAHDAGVCPRQVLLKLFDDVDQLVATPLQHPCPGCLAGRDQAIAGMRAGQWSIIVTGVIYGVPVEP